MEQMYSAPIALALNFFLLPLGYFYLKHPGRFVLGIILAFTLHPILSLVSWVLARISPLWLNAPLIFGISLLILILILIDTYRMVKKPDRPEAWPVFSKPNAYWFLPLYFVSVGTLSYFAEPWEKPFMQAHNIPSASMEPNILRGDFVFVDYTGSPREVERSDIIVHWGSGHNSEKKLIKRVVAVPGDKLRVFETILQGPEGELYSVLRYEINGKLQPLKFSPNQTETYRKSGNHLFQNTAIFQESAGTLQYDVLESAQAMGFRDQDEIRLTLGSDEYYVLGDNRDHAADSRFEGPVKRRQILGKYSYTYFGLRIPNPDCEMGPPVLFIVEALMAKSNTPCHGVSINWQRAGFRAG